MIRSLHMSSPFLSLASRKRGVDEINNEPFERAKRARTTSPFVFAPTTTDSSMTDSSPPQTRRGLKRSMGTADMEQESVASPSFPISNSPFGSDDNDEARVLLDSKRRRTSGQFSDASTAVSSSGARTSFENSLVRKRAREPFALHATGDVSLATPTDGKRRRVFARRANTPLPLLDDDDDDDDERRINHNSLVSLSPNVHRSHYASGSSSWLVPRGALNMSDIPRVNVNSPWILLALTGERDDTHSVRQFFELLENCTRLAVVKCNATVDVPCAEPFTLLATIDESSPSFEVVRESLRTRAHDFCDVQVSINEVRQRASSTNPATRQLLAQFATADPLTRLTNTTTPCAAAFNTSNGELIVVVVPDRAVVDWQAIQDVFS